METDLAKRIALYDASSGGHSDAAGANAYELLAEAGDEINILRATLSKHEAVTRAAIRLCNFFWKSLDVGPSDKDPSREAALWRDLRAAIRSILLPAPNPPTSEGE